VDVVYTDFLKAFDMIDHNLLLNKLESFGFSDDLVLLVKSYLDSRLMCVRLKGGLLNRRWASHKDQSLDPSFLTSLSTI
jgi:hypothetical protein